jgi:cytochrome b pre-mRNA-processing protein 6
MALKHWARIIKRWPVDKIRPESVSFQANMQRRIDRITNPSLNAAATSVKGNEALVTAVSPTEFNEAKEMKQVNALYSLLENRYSEASPMPPHFRHPASRTTHYDDLLQELEEAPARSKFSSWLQTLKGRFRLG